MPLTGNSFFKRGTCALDINRTSSLYTEIIKYISELIRILCGNVIDVNITNVSDVMFIQVMP